MPKKQAKSPPRTAKKPHDPTPAERDERYKIEGVTFEEAVERVLTAPQEQEETPPPTSDS